MFQKLNKKQQEWVEQMLGSMTEDEKIGQMVNEHGGHLMTRQSDPAAWLRKYPVGSIFCGAEVIDPAAAKADTMRPITRVTAEANLKIPMLFSGDFENGIGDQIDGFSRMPRLMGISATFRKEDAYEYGRIIGSEGYAINIRWAFGPVSDLNINRENPVTNIRSAGDDPDHALGVLKNVMKGMQDCGCAACPKHFPGDGSDTRNQHYVTSFNVLSRQEWDNLHGRVFRELIESGAMSIMIGHVAFPAYEAADPVKQIYRPATASKRLMTDLLRGELGFDGIILTDALCMNGYIAWGDYEQRILDTFNGGADVFLWPETERFFTLIKAALKDGRASRERLDESVRRILSFKVLLKLTEPPVPVSDREVADLVARNAKIAAEISERSITLLRNRAGHLPLKLSNGARILVLMSPNKPAPLEHLSEFSNELTRRGFQVTSALFSEFNAVGGVADAFEAVFLLTDANPQYSEYRAFDMMLWSFMANDKIKRRIIISFGTPYMLYDVAGCDTYINSYHDSRFSVIATIRAMFGEIPFQGKSPVSVPYCFALGDGLHC